MNQKQIAENNNLFDFYEKKLDYYRFWAKHHKLNYWILLWAILITGVCLTVALFIQFEPKIITIIAIVLNVLLIISKAIGSDEKYKRYRITEIKLEFMIQLMKTEINDLLLNGSSKDKANAEIIKKYHDQIESLVVSEFSDHFANQRSLEAIHQLVGKADITKKS